MLHLLQYILGIIFSCFGAILLLRAWLHYWALSPRHPLCEFVRRITDWLVVPISRVVPTRGGVHWSALLSALAVAVVAVLVHRTIGHLPATPIGLIIAPFAMMARWALEMISWGAIIWAVLSWVNRESPMTYTLAVLLDPFMRPIRRVLPTFRGIDFSPLVLMYRYASKLNFSGNSEYPLRTSVPSSVMEDINSNTKGSTITATSKSRKMLENILYPLSLFRLCILFPPI